MHLLISILLTTLTPPVPPLTDTQQAMLHQAHDSTFVDEPALYSLLDNVAGWQLANEAGAIVPDYHAIQMNPADHRGLLYLIEGQYVGGARRFGLRRTGIWGDAVTEWVIKLSDDPNDVAVIFFVDPDDTMPKVGRGERVRVAARFFKLWGDTDIRGEPTDYLVFVARSATLLGGGKGPWPMMPQIGPMVIALFVVLCLGLPMLWLLRKVVVKPIGRRTLQHPSVQETAEQLEAHLPIDPAEALEKLGAESTSRGSDEA